MPKSAHNKYPNKKNVNLYLSEKGVQGIDKLAQSLNVSRSELMEMIGHGEINLGSQSQLVGESSSN